MNSRLTLQADGCAAPTEASDVGVRRLSSPETMASLLQRIPQAFYITTEDGVIVDGNAALLELLGVPSLEHLQDVRVGDLLLQPAARAYQLELLARDGSVLGFELQIRRLDGQVRTVLDTAYRVRDPVTGEALFHGMLVDITAHREVEQRLRERAIRDPLTGCFNRWRLEEVMEQVDASDRSWGVVVVDIDGFKEFNDLRGHEAGDRALIRVVRRLAVAARAEDAVFRLGGDEFVILLMDVDLDGTKRLGERVRARNLEPGEVSVSSGWAVRRNREPLAATIVRADRWMVARRRHERAAAHAQPSRRSDDPECLRWPQS